MKFYKFLSLCSAGVLFVSCQSMPTSTHQGVAPGRVVPDGEIPTPADVRRDALAAQKMIRRNAPKGAITIFGSARSKPGSVGYEQTREFAKLWSEKYGEEYPILTGGSKGVMEAGNRGAYEANAKSLYIATYFDTGTEDGVNKYVTDGYLASSFAQREADLVDYAAGIVCAPGGVGTSWEIFESLSKIQTGKKKPCAIILLGSKATWRPLIVYMRDLAKKKTISPEDIDLLQIAETPEEAVRILQKSLKLK